MNEHEANLENHQLFSNQLSTLEMQSKHQAQLVLIERQLNEINSKVTRISQRLDTMQSLLLEIKNAVS